MFSVKRFVELSINNQFLTIYNNINIEFKRKIFKFKSITTISNFLTLLKNKKKYDEICFINIVITSHKLSFVNRNNVTKIDFSLGIE